MTILLDPRRNVSIDDLDPTALDREHAAMTSPFADEHHVDGPTPDDALTCTLDDEGDEDMGRWWEWMTDAELDQRWTLTIAGGRASAMALDASEDSERFA